MKKFAVFGNPIEQSISPLIHQDFAQQACFDIDYGKRLSERHCFEQDIHHFFSDSQVIGCNITAPFKEQAFSVADVKHKSAQDAQAANTLHTVGGKLEAHNTDGDGLVQDIVRILGDLQGARIALLGAGGAARGVIRPLLNQGIEQLTIANRTVEKAQQLVALSGKPNTSSCALNGLKGRYDVVINSTSSSLTGDIPDLGTFEFDGVRLTYDMSYKAKPTPFLVHAQEQGSEQCADGLGMLIGQAAVAFHIWTGFMPDTSHLLIKLRKGMSA